MPARQDGDILHRILLPIGVLATLGLACLVDSRLFTQTGLFSSTYSEAIKEPHLL